MGKKKKTGGGDGDKKEPLQEITTKKQGPDGDAQKKQPAASQQLQSASGGKTVQQETPTKQHSQPQGAWGGKPIQQGAPATQPSQPQHASGGKGQQQQHQTQTSQAQGAWGGKPIQPQGAWGGKPIQQGAPATQPSQPQHGSGGKGQQHQTQTSEPQGAWGGKAGQQQPSQLQGASGGKYPPQQPHLQQQGRPQQQQQGRPEQQQQPQGRSQQQQEQSRHQQGRPQQQQQQEQSRQQGRPQQQQQGRPQQQQQGRPQQQQQGRPQQQQQQEQSRQQQGRPQQQQQQSSPQQQQGGQPQRPKGDPQSRDKQQQQARPQQEQPQGKQQQHIKESSSVSSITSGLSDITVQSTISSQASTKSLSATQRSNVSLARGTRGQRITVETNYLELILDKMKDYAYQYDIKFVPDTPKRFLRLAFIEYCKALRIPDGGLAFDGKANVFSPKQLGPQYVTACEVKVLEPESGQEKTFKVTLMETQDSTIELKSLKTYQNDRIFDKPMRALQCLDVILSSPCHQKGTRGGRSFYNPPADGSRIDLTESYELWLGLFQAAVLGERPFLNIDISHRAFPSALPLINVIQSLAGRRGHNLAEPLPTWLERAVHDYLRGLVVVYHPPKCLNSIPKRYKYQNIKMASNRQNFTLETGQKLTVADYFKDKGCKLEYPNLPCIHVGNTIKTIYIPAEFLQVAAGQLNLKKAGPQQVASMIRYAATSTDVRKDKILKQFDYMEHNKNPTLRYFGVGVGTQFIKVDARILNAPSLEYNQRRIESRNGSWNGADYIIPAQCLQWAILILDERTYENDCRNFGQMIVNAGRKLNMNISDKFALFKIPENRLEENLRKFKDENRSIVFVIISGRNQNSYSKVKQNAEMRFGVLTQCIKPDTITRRLNNATIQNILLKVNAKLNGFNHRIHPQSSTIIMKDKNVMFIGADVTHPTPDQRSIPSVVGVVASHDLDGFQYNMKWCLQEPTKEIIIHMQDITLHHLNVYEENNKKLPEVIIYYRDGVSEGQFPDITNVELRAMDAAFSKKRANYRPKLTCLIVQKRHHTRFFPQARQGVGKFNNVPPGTCVDQTITHPNESQFFLVSHESIQGTAKPTKYCVLRDDSNFNIDDLQAITYNMCHMFARCNRSVSYPAPAYYAHHGASRGKIYIEGQNLNMEDLQKETRKREIKHEIVGGHPMFFV